MRGLKPVFRTDSPYRISVASYTGAWIETACLLHQDSAGLVASYTGAWIETYLIGYIGEKIMSHPIRVRGLKLEIRLHIHLTESQSHPIRVRGLKQNILMIEI